MPEGTAHTSGDADLHHSLSGNARQRALTSDTTSQEYPFSDPVHNTADLADLGRMQASLRLTLANTPGDPMQLDRIYDERGLRTQRGLTVVGFRGLCRPDISEALQGEVSRVDTALAAQLQRDESRLILGYSSCQLGPYDTLNLVVMRDESGLRYWHESALHRYAAQELSPRLYHGVRLHIGVLPQGLAGSLQLCSTKYYAFGAAPWHAQRQYPAPLPPS